MDDVKPGRRSKRRVTLKDLAEHAGVSLATVSLVMMKSPLVAAKTRERVQASAEALGYVYNRGAAYLRLNRTHTIGVAINELTNPYFTELTSSIQRSFRELGRTVFLADCEEDYGTQAQFVAAMREHNADGLVICPSQHTPAAALSVLREEGPPCVLISRYVPGCDLDYAGHANQRGTFLVAEHLIGLGHRRIAMIGGNSLTSTGRERRAGYLQALEANQLPVDPRLIVEGMPTRVTGADAIKSLLTLPDPPTAAMCFNDVLAFGVMLGLRQIGMEAGRDFAVAGYDDLEEAALWTPALTTVRIDSSAIGLAAAKMLLERIEQPDLPARRSISEPQLIIRESSQVNVR